MNATGFNARYMRPPSLSTITAAALDGSLNLALKRCGPEPQNETIMCSKAAADGSLRKEPTASAVIPPTPLCTAALDESWAQAPNTLAGEGGVGTDNFTEAGLPMKALKLEQVLMLDT